MTNFYYCVFLSKQQKLFVIKKNLYMNVPHFTLTIKERRGMKHTSIQPQSPSSSSFKLSQNNNKNITINDK